MTERTRQHLRDLRTTLLISFGIALVMYLGAPRQVAPKDWRFVVVSGLSFGIGFFFIGLAVPHLRFRSFLLTNLARSVLYWGTIVVCIGIVSITGIALSIPAAVWDPRVIDVFRDVMTKPFVYVSAGLAFLLAMAITSVVQFSRKLGPGILRNWMLGKYHEPREEERIFMFLDLKNSTTLAEKLGNIRFSRLCQDFFRDLTYPVLESKGEVSHYIGDEAVLTWRPARGLAKGNCIRCFYLMEAAIATRAAMYQQEYGIVPEFKAGVHIGMVVGAEVGEIKSEIVYHGDVLNTTARITGMCSSLDSDLLISGDLLRRIELPPGLHATSHGLHLLKGKEHEVEIVSISAGSASAATATRELQPIES